MSFAAAAILKATLALMLALAATAAVRRAVAATRHAILVAGQLAALTVPLLALVVPHVKFDVAPLRNAQTVAVRRAAAMNVSLPPTTLPDPSTSSRNMLTIVWALGCAVIAARRLLSFARALALVRRATPHGDFLMSDEIDHPIAFGSRIVLPPDAAHWDDERLRAVLAHERAHVARHDSLQGAIGDAVCAIYWFHPLAWLTARHAALAREQACDDSVLEEGIAPDAYAAAILDVARTLRRRTDAAHGLPMATPSQLEVRLRAILAKGRVPRITRTARIGVTAAALACAPFLAALTPRGIEPDLLGDAYSSPFSEYIAVDTIPDVEATGPDAALIAMLQQVARHPRRSEIDFVADRARWALGRVRNGELVVPLIESLHDSDWRIRAYAAFNLSVARDPRATSTLLPLLDDRIWRVRAMTATALANIGDPDAASAMKRALDDDAWQVRMEAVRYFDVIGADRALFESMKHDRHMAVRAAVQEALQ